MSKLETLKKCTTNIDFLNLIFPGTSSKYKYLEVIFGLKDSEKYSTIQIPKKSGGTRDISIPIKELKEIQTNTAKLFSDCYEELYGKTNLCAHGFIRDHSIISNAKPHRNKNIIINTDLNNFFPSITFGRIRNYFIRNRNFILAEPVATLIAKICCNNGKLSQGSPSSPIISNLICRILDTHLYKLAKKNKCTYSRYADDITFSTNLKFVPSGIAIKKEHKYIVANELEKIIIKDGFSINQKKTRVSFNSQKQEVTGLVVNHKVNVSRKYFDKTKAMAHRYYLTGELTIDGKESNVNQLLGRFDFINQLEKYNNKLLFKLNEKKSPRYVLYTNNQHKVENQLQLKKTKMTLNGVSPMHYELNFSVGYKFLSKREKEYSKLLYYQTFINNEMPVIVTEGKTDILYLKAALKNMYMDYPELVEKKNDKFYYKIHFFKVTKLNRYLLDINPSGNGLFKVLGPKCQYPKKTRKSPNPVMLLIDNEIGEGKPLSQISKKWKDKYLNTKGYSNITDEFPIPINKKKNKDPNFKELLKIAGPNKFYLVTIPKINSNSDADIESLFTDDTLKKYDFQRSRRGDKERFSNVVFKDYKNINFDRFRHLFNMIKEISIKGS